MASAQYRLLSAAGQASEEGSADVEVADGALVLTPSGGDVLRVPLGQIASVAAGGSGPSGVRGSPPASRVPPQASTAGGSGGSSPQASTSEQFTLRIALAQGGVI